MQLTALSAVKHRIHVGEPLPFNVRNADRTLLLARGQVVGTAGQLEALFDRGALVDIAELQTAADLLQRLPREQLPQRWQQCMGRVASALEHAPHEGFRGALDDAAAPVLALIERDPDLAIFQVLRSEGGERTAYGVRRSLNSAITAFLVAQRLGWDEAGVQKVFKVALTMNLSMLELQGQLAVQTEPVSPEQRAAILSHPQRSVEMLELSGVTDREWLDGVADHHVAPDGSGYPAGRHEVNDFAALVRRADIYTAKLSPRTTRSAMAADRAGRAMFMYDPGNSMTAALVKEFGVYPPGCFVKLVSGETAVVVKRGPSVVTPLVAALTTSNGTPLVDPVPRDTSKREHAIAGVIGEGAVTVRIEPEKLMKLALA